MQGGEYDAPELRKAHQANDKAVMKACGCAPSMTEPEIVADLMKRYQELKKQAVQTAIGGCSLNSFYQNTAAIF